MPAIGEIKRGLDIGYKGTSKYIYQTCKDCGGKRWVMLQKGIPNSVICYPCSVKYQFGKGNAHWKGGRVKTVSGYIRIILYPDDFFYPMCRGRGYIQEHRLVMAKSLNRCLLPWEIVHHKNGIKDDNRLENLRLLPSQTFHIVDTQMKQYIHRQAKQIKQLQARVTFLEAELVLIENVPILAVSSK